MRRTPFYLERLLGCCILFLPIVAPRIDDKIRGIFISNRLYIGCDMLSFDIMEKINDKTINVTDIIIAHKNIDFLVERHRYAAAKSEEKADIIMLVSVTYF